MAEMVPTSPARARMPREYEVRVHAGGRSTTSLTTGVPARDPKERMRSPMTPRRREHSDAGEVPTSGATPGYAALERRRPVGPPPHPVTRRPVPSSGPDRFIPDRALSGIGGHGSLLQYSPSRPARCERACPLAHRCAPATLHRTAPAGHSTPVHSVNRAVGASDPYRALLQSQILGVSSPASPSEGGDENATQSGQRAQSAPRGCPPPSHATHSPPSHADPAPLQAMGAAPQRRPPPQKSCDIAPRGGAAALVALCPLAAPSPAAKPCPTSVPWPRRAQGAFASHTPAAPFLGEVFTRPALCAGRGGAGRAYCPPGVRGAASPSRPSKCWTHPTCRTTTTSTWCEAALGHAHPTQQCPRLTAAHRA